MTIKTIILLTILCILNILDFGITSVLIERHGIEVEANIIQYWLLDTFNTIWSILVFKCVALFIIILATINKAGIFAYTNVMDFILFLINLIYIGVVSWGMYLVVYNV